MWKRDEQTLGQFVRLCVRLWRRFVRPDEQVNQSPTQIHTLT